MSSRSLSIAYTCNKMCMASWQCPKWTEYAQCKYPSFYDLTAIKTLNLYRLSSDWLTHQMQKRNHTWSVTDETDCGNHLVYMFLCYVLWNIKIICIYRIGQFLFTLRSLPEPTEHTALKSRVAMIGRGWWGRAVGVQVYIRPLHLSLG